jgi:membrane protein implicated in regulation of membrane protease activity
VPYETRLSFWHSQDGGWQSLARDEAAIGTVGVLTIATRGPAGPGEVRVKVRGGSERYLAWSESPLPKGATVLVIDYRGPRSVDVMEWADPLGEAPVIPGSPSNPHSGE